MYTKNYPRITGGKNDFNFFWSFGLYLFYLGTEKSLVFIRPFFKNGHWTWWFFLLVCSLGFGSLVFQDSDTLVFLQDFTIRFFVSDLDLIFQDLDTLVFVRIFGFGFCFGFGSLVFSGFGFLYSVIVI